jgi:hypothetical protein
MVGPPERGQLIALEIIDTERDNSTGRAPLDGAEPNLSQPRETDYVRRWRGWLGFLRCVFVGGRPARGVRPTRAAAMRRRPFLSVLTPDPSVMPPAPHPAGELIGSPGEAQRRRVIDHERLGFFQSGLDATVTFPGLRSRRPKGLSILGLSNFGLPPSAGLVLPA